MNDRKYDRKYDRKDDRDHDRKNDRYCDRSYALERYGALLKDDESTARRASLRACRFAFSKWLALSWMM
jgi:hypothetical protein